MACPVPQRVAHHHGGVFHVKQQAGAAAARRVCLVNAVYDPRHTTPQEALAAWETLTGWAAGLAAQGLAVTVVQRFSQAAQWTADGVRWVFVADGLPPWPRALHGLGQMVAAVVAARPQVVHYGSFLQPLALRRLRRALPQAAAIVVQHHAEQPRQRLTGWLQRRCCPLADAFLFTGRETALPYVAAGVLPDLDRVAEVMEGSTSFTPGDRAAAQAALGWRGEPLLLAIGHLVAGKDPLTLLAGAGPVLAARPAARLALVYRRTDLLPEVRAQLAAQPSAAQVDLLGELPHHHVETALRAADLYVSASHREGSSYALCEALACGCLPVVSDLPPHRYMVGSVGATWPVGQPAALTAALEQVLAGDRPQQRAAARRQFEELLSWPAIGRIASAVYATALARRAAVQ
ncbi:MAG: glycosyltransferase family 4 protein [Fimbriimonadaceae bacterium]|nr:glycosyltransferase family 4 protein [Fimbriimonadaceae bacterium]